MASRTVAEQHDKRVTSKTAAASKAAADGWKGFVQMELNEQQKLAVKVLRDKGMEQVWTGVFALVDELYKLSLSYDTYNDAYICSATCKDPKDKNMGLTLTARGGSLQGAVASFWYKHTTVLEGDWTAAAVKGVRKVDEDDVG